MDHRRANLIVSIPTPHTARVESALLVGGSRTAGLELLSGGQPTRPVSARIKIEIAFPYDGHDFVPVCCHTK